MIRSPRPVLLLVLGLLLTACGGAVATDTEPTLAADSPPAVEASATLGAPSPEPSPASKATPGGPAPVARTEEEVAAFQRGYGTLLILDASATLLEETAARIEAGDLGGGEALGASIAIGAFLGAVDESLDQPSPAPVFDDAWDDARPLLRLLARLVSEWYDGQRTAAEIADDLGPIRADLAALFESLEADLAQEYGVEASELRQLRQEAMQDMRSALEGTSLEDPVAVSEATPSVPLPPPFEAVELSGEGPTVTDNIALTTCRKAVFDFTVDADDFGGAQLIVDLHRVGDDGSTSLVAAFENEATSALTGAVHEFIAGGDYFVEVSSASGPWGLRIECRDDEPAAGTHLSVSGNNLTVTENYSLEACQKSVFTYQVEPDDFDSVQLLATLVAAGSDRAVNLVTAFESARDESLLGEVLQPLAGGKYFLAIESASGPWSIEYECRD